jgi:hypothetical protein
MKRYQIVAFVAAWSVLGSTVVFAQETTTTWPTKPFSDVPSSRSDYDAIEYLRQQKVLKGYEDGTFKPDSRINRAEMVKLIANPFILDTARLNDCINENIDEDDQTIFFSDVRRDVWYGPELCLAHIGKIVNGYPDGTFQPGNNLNFAEAAKIIVSTFALQTHTDPTDERWFIPYVNALSEHSAIPTTIDRFDDVTTRGEMAEIMYRLKADKENSPSKTTGQIK